MNSLARLFTFALLLAGLAMAGPSRAEVEVPPLSARVTDLTGTLTAQQAQTLESRLAEFEAQKGSQVAVLIVPTTQPETIEQYGMRVVEQWKLGRKGVDDGALLLVAKEDRKLRIEVGYGLEGALNDATAKRIVAEVIAPEFKRGDFYAGIDAGLAAMLKVIAGEPLPAPQAEGGDWEAQPVVDLDDDQTMWVLGIVVAIGIAMGLWRGRFAAGSTLGGGLGVLVWLLSGYVVAALVVGVVIFLFILAGGGGTGGHYSGGTGGWSSGSSDSWGSGGDSFSGGGDFGGGGASGDW